MINRLLIFISFFLITVQIYAVNISGETAENMYEEKVKNVNLLDSVFSKLARLEQNKEGKVNIIHIGDSHIQADFFTNAIRESLQEKFGNAGYGFTFPYNLARCSNGTKFFKFVSNTAWQSCRNNQAFKCGPDTRIGLCGYGFSSQAKEFVISLDVQEEKYKFNTIKIISPNNPSDFKLATAEGNPVIQSVQSGVKYHKIKNGESLSTIASRYKVSMAAIKKENNLKSNTIYAGKTLRIPVTTRETKVNMSLFQPLEYQEQDAFAAVYHNNRPISKLYLLPNQALSTYNLNGLVLEKDEPGLIYHNIGTIGSKASDFNATPLFFDQLPALSPDLIIISFGTNESFGRIPVEEFMMQMNQFIQNVRRTCPESAILVMTPPTSLFRRRVLNTFASEYSGYLMQQNEYALWDLYSFTGGITGARQPMLSQISSDNVHYTAQGYTNQGKAFADNFIMEYENYKRNHPLQENKKEALLQSVLEDVLNEPEQVETEPSY